MFDKIAKRRIIDLYRSEPPNLLELNSFWDVGDEASRHEITDAVNKAAATAARQ